MKCSKTQQPVSDFKNGKEAMSIVDAYSPEEAMLVANKMFRRECAGWGDEDKALQKLGRMFGMSEVSVKRLLKGQRKTWDVRLCKRIRLSYLTFCRSMLTEIENDMKAIEEAHGHEAVADIMDETEALVAKVEVAKAAAQRAYQAQKGR